MAKLNPMQFLKKAMPPLTFAFTARSSAGALPMNIKTQVQDLGVSDGVANFAGPFGLSIGQNGCAGIYPAMLAVMAAPAAGIDPTSISFILMLIVVCMISSFGVAGVGGGATFASLIVLSVMDLPVAIVGLMVTVEPLIDMGRTALNVSDSMLAGVLTSKITGDLNHKKYIIVRKLWKDNKSKKQFKMKKGIVSSNNEGTIPFLYFKTFSMLRKCKIIIIKLTFNRKIRNIIL